MRIKYMSFYWRNGVKWRRIEFCLIGDGETLAEMISAHLIWFINSRGLFLLSLRRPPRALSASGSQPRRPFKFRIYGAVWISASFLIMLFRCLFFFFFRPKKQNYFIDLTKVLKRHQITDKYQKKGWMACLTTNLMSTFSFYYVKLSNQ